jgi:hypothetical protein
MDNNPTPSGEARSVGEIRSCTVYLLHTQLRRKQRGRIALPADTKFHEEPASSGKVGWPQKRAVPLSRKPGAF